MLKKISLAIPLLLCAQSTGYAASAAMKEMIEFGVPAARRVLSTVRPLASLFTFQPPVPLASPPSYVTRRYFSHTLDSVALPTGISYRAFSAGSSERDSSDLNKAKSYKRWRAGAVEIGGEEFVKDFEHAEIHCFQTFRRDFPEFKDHFDRVEPSLREAYDCSKKGLKLIRNYRLMDQFTEGKGIWKSISPKIIEIIRIKGDKIEGDTETYTDKKNRIDRMFEQAVVFKDRDFFDLPLDEAIEAFLSHGNTEICAVDPGLAYIVTEVCNEIKNLKGYKDIGYPRDLDMFLSSWTWKLMDLINLGKDLTPLEMPVKKFIKVVRDFEKEVGISDAPYSSRVEAMIGLLKKKQ